jgi:Leucine-rich repeat (LRR) protein
MSFSDDDIELSFEDLHRIPQNIFEINPKSLFLTGNILTSLPTEFFCKFSNLNILHLSYNKLKTIPKEFGKLVNLERLYLDHNSIHEFQSGIQTCKYLKKLDLSYNNIQNLPKNEFSKLEFLHFIDLTENPISEENEKLKKILNAKELDEILNNVIIKQFNSFELILEHPLNLDFLKIEVEEEIDLSKIPLNDEFVKLNVNNDENVFNRDDKDSEMSRNRESVQIL